MKLGRPSPSWQRIASYVSYRTSVRVSGERPPSRPTAPQSRDGEVSWRRFDLLHGGRTPLSGWRGLENSFRLQSNGSMGSCFYSSAKVSADSKDRGGPVGVDHSSLLEEEHFHELADDVLHHLQDKIEVYGEDLNVDGFDLDYSSGVLTVRLGDRGTYVINKQTPNRQIWLSSPLSGPGRFDWSKSKSAWIYRRNNVELVALLENELSELLGSTIHLSGG